MQTKSDIVINVINYPFITLTESNIIPNVWYHDEMDYLFILTAKGFKLVKGSKERLIKTSN